MSTQSPAIDEFIYDDYSVDSASNTLTCRYRWGSWTFTEQVRLPGGGDWSTPAAQEAARLVFLLAGISYYKAGAAPVINMGAHALTDTEREFLTSYYIDGLGEFAHRSSPRLDLSGLTIRAPKLERSRPVGFSAPPGTPLIPFGGGVDSIVTVELSRGHTAAPSLFVVNRPGDRFEAIEQPSAVTGLPTVRAERLLDPQILRSRELGFRNGHVPVTGIISAIAVLAAVVGGHDAVVMSNEWSASVGTVEVDGVSVNHQYSKSMAFETAFRRVVAESIGDGLEYFSRLRPYTELWIAQKFSRLPQYFSTFRSCNRAFTIDRAKRMDHWCGVCDKCCFIDLILAPFVDASVLREVFAEAGEEPLENPSLIGSFENLLGLVPDQKPWECVGDINECRVAAHLSGGRADRAGNALLGTLTHRLEPLGSGADGHIAIDALMKPVGGHNIPTRYLSPELLGK